MNDVNLIQSLLRYEDGRLFWISGRKAGSEAGCERPDGRFVVRVGGRGGKLWMRYRLVWVITKGEIPSMEVDHINGVRFDDRIENLRLATSSQQKWNRGATSRNRSGKKGVVPVKGKFSAQICRNGKSTYLGSFSTVDEAHAAYAKAALIEAGEFARFA